MVRLHPRYSYTTMPQVNFLEPCFVIWFLFIIVLLDNLEKQMDSIDYNKLYEERLNTTSNLPGIVLPGFFLFELLDKSGIMPQMRDSILLLIDQMTVYLTQSSNYFLKQPIMLFLDSKKVQSI